MRCYKITSIYNSTVSIELVETEPSVELKNICETINYCRKNNILVRINNWNDGKEKAIDANLIVSAEELPNAKRV